jgi:hypothetical protein
MVIFVFIFKNKFIIYYYYLSFYKIKKGFSPKMSKFLSISINKKDIFINGKSNVVAI